MRHADHSWKGRVDSSAVLAVAGTRHDASWLRQVGDHVEYLIYQHDDPRKPNYFRRDGNEAGAYLQFINDYFDCLPNVSLQLKRLISFGWGAY